MVLEGYTSFRFTHDGESKTVENWLIVTNCAHA